MARATRVSAPRKALLLAGAILACLAHNLVLAPLVHAAPSAAAAPGFDTAEAQRLLLALCVGGPRIAGSQAASAAVALLLRELGAVSELARAAGATLEFEAVDSGHGSFETDFLDGFTNSYQGVVSVAARLTWPGAAREAVLLSSHFDTWSSSPGASDDAVHVATTVGVLRALAAGPARGVSVLAFFSGAEESNWVAAHAFATRHRWAADYRAVLNLEAIGAGGDLVAFQMGPRAGWLASALGDAGTQRGSVFAHDLFQIPGFPAGDDFKTLVAHAPHRGGAVRVTGVDFATIEAGYHYHTPLDQPVDTGGYPQMRSHGEGLLAKTRAAMAGLRRELDAAAADGGNGGAAGGERGARAPHENEQTVDGPSDVVYFDLYGLAWVTYSASTGVWLHLLAAATALGAIAVTGAGPSRAAAELAAMVGALLAAALVGGLVAAVHPLATYGRPALAAGAYGGSALAVSLAVRLRLSRRAGAPEPAESGKAGKAASKAGKAATEAKGARLLASAPSSAAVAAGATPGEGWRRAAAAALVPWLLALLPMQACGLGSAYLPAYYLGVNGAALLGAAVVAVSSPAAAAALQLCGALLPTVHAAELCRQLIAVLLPITARSGAVLPTDPLVAVVYAVTAVCTSSVLVAPLPRRVAARSAGGLGLVAVCCVCFALGSRASPFTDATPKRLVVQHIYRELEGAPHSSGLWVSAFDFSGLRELRETPAAAALLPAVAARTPYACDLDPLTPAPPPAAGRLLFDPPVRPTGCYLSLPFYFPLGGVLGTPDGQGAVFATTVAGRSVKPPPIPQRKRVRIERTGAAPGPEPGSHTLSLRVSGPSHMGVAAPETRLLAWSFAAAEAPRPPVPRRSPFAPDERLHFAFLTCGSGGGAEPCLWDLTLVVNGSAPLPLAVTGHYPDIADTPELEALSEALPTELRADWHWFSSMVQRVELPVGGAETVAYS